MKFEDIKPGIIFTAQDIADLVRDAGMETALDQVLDEVEAETDPEARKTLMKKAMTELYVLGLAVKEFAPATYDTMISVIQHSTVVDACQAEMAALKTEHITGPEGFKRSVEILSKYYLKAAENFDKQVLN